jgi:hypothetical protein
VPRDLSLPLRRAVVAHLRGDANVMALVEKVYGEFATQDTGNFVRMGDQTVTGAEYTCWDGSESEFTIHCFSYSDTPGRDAIQTIAARVQASMEQFEPAGFGLPENEWVRTVYLPDEVPQRMHAVITYRMVAVEMAG